MPDNVVSFFFLGTACHRSCYQDALTHFYQKVSEQKTPARLFDGVGSVAVNAEEAEKNPTPGQYVYNSQTGQKIRIAGKILQTVRDFLHQWQGCLTGEGMNELMFEAIFFVEEYIKKNGRAPEAINLHGYSRGADACMRLAHLLNTLYPDVNVNMFLAEHVAGPGRSEDPSSYTIPPNVAKFESATMLHEYKPGFDPQDRDRYVISNARKTKISTKVYPGWHGTAMYLTENENTNHVPRLLHDDFFRFAQETGSLPADAQVPNYKVMHSWTNYTEREAKLLTPEMRFKEYVEMQKHWWFYSKGTELNTRRVLTEHRRFVRNSELFVNQEHWELFEKLFPRVTDWFFNNNSLKQEETSLETELGSLKKTDLKFYEAFCRSCGIKNGMIPEPRKKLLFPYPKLGEALVSDDFSFLQHSILAIVNYHVHHRNENTVESRAATRVLLAKLSQAKASNSREEATQILLTTISSTSTYLSQVEPRSYMARQLKKLNVGPKQFIEEATTLLKENIGYNLYLHESQKNYLREVTKDLESLQSDQNIPTYEKLRRAKMIVREIPLNLNDRTDEVFAFNRQAESYFRFSNPPYTYKKLISSLNRLSSRSFGESTLAYTMAKRFSAYEERSKFWELVHKVLSTLSPVEIPPFFPPDKKRIAKTMQKNLQKLDKYGLGDNLTELLNILSAGEKMLHELYKTTGNLIQGELDRIIETCKGEIWPEIDTSHTEALRA
jgi:hypothetical protein